MINYYQPFLFPFLGSKKSTLPNGVKRYYYYSFEDALWELLAQKHIQKGAVILVPNFYCMDVVGNIQNHGYTPIFYPVNKQFQITPQKLNKLMQRHHPFAVILFHACGITNRVLTSSWIKNHQDMLIIEDCVQQLINPAFVKIFSNNHFIIDSLRKVSPIPGSFIYGTHNGLSFKPPHTMHVQYMIRSFFWYVTFRTVLGISAVTHWSNGSIWAHEILLKHHDDIIGDEPTSSAGIPWLGSISNWFDHERIRKRKIEQTILYQTLTPTLPHSLFYRIKIPPYDFGALHVYPLGMKYIPDQFIDGLHRLGIAVWCKFEDAPWAKHSHVLFLPLGFHVSDEEIRYTITTIRRLTVLFLFPAS